MNLRLLENHTCWVAGYDVESDKVIVEVEGWSELVADRLGSLEHVQLEVKTRDTDDISVLDPSNVDVGKQGFRASFPLGSVLSTFATPDQSDGDAATLDLSLSGAGDSLRLRSPYYSEPFTFLDTLYCKPYQTIHGNHSLKLKVTSPTSAKQVFEGHFRANRWGSAESRSGRGSTLVYTEGLRSELPGFLERYNVTSVLDAPCGDYNWFSEVRPELDATYHGVDIVEDLISANRAKYEDLRTTFDVKDIIDDAVGEYDLILCRDCLFHLPYEMIFRALFTFVNSGSRYLLTTSHYDCKYNTDIPLGEYRQIDLCKSPFDFPPPIEKIDDYPEGKAPRFLGLWELDSLAERLETNPMYVAANSHRFAK